jgi:hypothetical protein
MTLVMKLCSWFAVLACTGSLLSGMDVASIRKLSLAQLEERMVEIEQGLQSLAYFSLNSGMDAGEAISHDSKLIGSPCCDVHFE